MKLTVDATTKRRLDEAAAARERERQEQLEYERALSEQLAKDNPTPRVRHSHVEPKERHARVRWRRYQGR
jgi:hypothetical protein